MTDKQDKSNNEKTGNVAQDADFPTSSPEKEKSHFNIGTKASVGDSSIPFIESNAPLEPQENLDVRKEGNSVPLDRRLAVITGASSGIGQASAQAFAKAGWSLVLAARSGEDLESVAVECREFGAEVLTVPTDVCEIEAVQALAAAATDFGGEIDLWFSNVGVGAAGKFLDVPMATHEQIIRSNLIGHMNDAHTILPLFIKQGRGVFVNMISLGGFSASPFLSAYSASKFGLKGFAESVRAELADYPNVHLCDVYPSFVDTPALRHAGNYTGKALSAPPPLLDPRYVADAVVALADKPRNSVVLGAPSWAARLSHFISPSLNGRLVKTAFDRYFASADTAPLTDGNVLVPPSDGAVIDGGFRTPPSKRNTEIATAAGIGIAALGIFALLARKSRLAKHR